MATNRITFHGFLRISCYPSSQTVGPKERGTNKQTTIKVLGGYFTFQSSCLSDRNNGEGKELFSTGNKGNGDGSEWNKKVNLNGLILMMIVYPRRDGPHPEVVQYWGNPWDRRSKLHSESRVSKIDVISWEHCSHTRYYTRKNSSNLS